MSIVTASVIAGSGDDTAIGSPTATVIVSAPGRALASSIAARSVPGPASLALSTEIGPVPGAVATSSATATTTGLRAGRNDGRGGRDGGDDARAAYASRGPGARRRGLRLRLIVAGRDDCGVGLALEEPLDRAQLENWLLFARLPPPPHGATLHLPTCG